MTIAAGVTAVTRYLQGLSGQRLTAAKRMELMPLAQSATRIGGAITVTLVLIALARLG